MWKAALAVALIFSSLAMTSATVLHHWRECHKAAHSSLDQEPCHATAD
jgi:hypothetical protein